MQATATLAGISCGHCKAKHASVQEVRQCYFRHLTQTPRQASTVQVQPRQAPTVLDAAQRIKLAAAKLPDVAKAYYALMENCDWKFYMVAKPQKGRWHGYTFLSVQASDYLHSVRDRVKTAAILEALSQRGAAQAMADYGHQIGRCGMCHRTLTDAESIRRGIGPVCLERLA